MDNQITILVESCTMQIHLRPFFGGSTIANQKKLIRYIFQEPWRNVVAIRTLDEYLQRGLEGARCALECALGRAPQNEVKRCKADYERWGRIVAYYESIKTRNKMKFIE